jgi:NADPH:quinone reductase-like Zn-dependent oxidoreductase
VTIRIATAGSRGNFEALVRAMEQHGMHPCIDRVFPVDSFAEAFGYLERGGHFGKVVLELR